LKRLYFYHLSRVVPQLDVNATSITVSRICQQGITLGHLDSESPLRRAYLSIPTSEGTLSQYAPRVP